MKSEKRVRKSLKPEKRQGRMRTQPGTEYIARMGSSWLPVSTISTPAVGNCQYFSIEARIRDKLWVSIILAGFGCI